MGNKHYVHSQKKEQKKEMVSIWEQYDFIVIEEQFNGLLGEGANLCAYGEISCC